MNKKNVYIWYTNWSLKLVLMIPVLVAVNIIGNLICNAIGLPLWLDTLGTFTGSIIGGPIYGAIVAAIYQVIACWDLGLAVMVLYMLGAVAAAIMFGLLNRFGLILNYKQAIRAGIILALFVTIIQMPINLAIDGGYYEANIITKSLYEFFDSQVGLNIPLTSLISRVVAELLDKVISIFIVYKFHSQFGTKINKYFNIFDFMNTVEIVTPEDEITVEENK